MNSKISTRCHTSLHCAAVFLITTGLFAAESTTGHKVTRGSLKTAVQWDAVFESKEMQPVRLAPKAWFDMTVVDAVEHGSRVEKGDPLVRLDLDKLRDLIADSERDQLAAKTALDVAEAELRNLTAATPQKLETARRNQKIAGEELEYFVTVGRDQREKSATFNVKSAEDRLGGAKEELRQLEKMYKADDLVEETEEIILKRQRFAVETAEYYFVNARQFADREIKTTLPRDLETYKAKKRDEELALELFEITLPRTLEKKRQDVEKLHRDQEKASRRLADLKLDLAAMEVRSPASGIVYYGACEQGRWTSAALVSKKLVAGGKLMANEVFMTVVDPARLQLHATVAESDLSRLKAGMKAEAIPAAAPQLKLNATLEEIGFVPLPSGGFDASLSVKLEKGARLVPGLNCKVIFKDVPRAEALLVPKGAVITEPKQNAVMVRTGGKEEKRIVKTGESDDTMTEILEGLKAGETVLVKKSE